MIETDEFRCLRCGTRVSLPVKQVAEPLFKVLGNRVSAMAPRIGTFGIWDEDAAEGASPYAESLLGRGAHLQPVLRADDLHPDVIWERDLRLCPNRHCIGMNSRSFEDAQVVVLESGAVSRQVPGKLRRHKRSVFGNGKPARGRSRDPSLSLPR
jgi:hypothetical protein